MNHIYQKKPYDITRKPHKSLILFEAGTGYQMHLTGRLLQLLSTREHNQNARIICLDSQGGFNDSILETLQATSGPDAYKLDNLKHQPLTVFYDPSPAFVDTELIPYLNNIHGDMTFMLVISLLGDRFSETILNRLVSLPFDVSLYLHRRDFGNVNMALFNRQIALHHFSQDLKKELMSDK